MTAELVEATTTGEAAQRPGRVRLRAAFWSVAPHLAYLLLALVLTARLWIHRDVRLTAINPTDHEQFLWFFANAAHSLVHGENPLLTHQLNAPDQVNLMANTSVLGLGIPLAPVTLLFGPATTFVLALVLTLAGTASAWYWLLSRHVVDSKLAAFVGAGFCGFGPGMVAQASGHPNLTAQFLIPFILWWVVRLRERGREIRNGVVLGLLVTFQVFINEEILFLTALACAVFIAVYALSRWTEVRGQVRPFLVGLGVAAGTAGVLLAYPLWVQFFGPGHYRGLPPGVDRYATDLASFPAFARKTLAGSAAVADKLGNSANEEASFLGLPLLIFTIVAAVAMWRQALVRGVVAAGVVCGLISLGPAITIAGHRTNIPGPLRVLRHIPPFELATATRYALVIVPVVGVLLALACAALFRYAGTDRRRWVLVAVLILAVLLPDAPVPLRVFARPVPAFITSGEWRRYVDADHSLVPVPVPRNTEVDGMRWAAVAKAEFAIPRGYFIGPRSATDPRASYDPPLRPTSTLLRQVELTGKVPAITQDDRLAAQADLRYWRAAVVVVSATDKRVDALVGTLNALLGPGTWDAAGGVWLWDVRPLTAR